MSKHENVQESEPLSLADAAKAHTDLLAKRILHALEIYPYMSASMIHMAIGTSTSTSIWRPVLEHLVEAGKVTETDHISKSPLDRTQTYTIYHLPSNPYPYN